MSDPIYQRPGSEAKRLRQLELKEVSIVPVGANTEALVVLNKELKKMDTEMKKIYDALNENFQKRVDVHIAAGLDLLTAMSKVHDELVADIGKANKQATDMLEARDKAATSLTALEKAAQDAGFVISKNGDTYTISKTDKEMVELADGTRIEKGSVPDGVLNMLKSQAADIADLRKKQNDALVLKAAKTDFPNLALDDAGMISLMGSVMKIKDNKDIIAALKSASNALESLTKQTGSEVDPGTNPEAEQLEKMAKDHAAANPGLSFDQAYAKVSTTPEGAKLFAALMGR
jgi:uncharacterized membrane-anchored protein YhcB (DUF1043 family)